MNQPEMYYEQDRSELLDLMPQIKDAKILDVGCGAGKLGKLLKEHGCGEVHGIEVVQTAAKKAMEFYDAIYTVDIEKGISDIENEYFDIIICADVLEHLKDPWTVLSDLKTYLRSNGAFIASIPNVRCGKVIGRLLSGEFGYDNEGILDKTHLRFFTFNGCIKLFAECGLKITQIVPTYFTEADTSIPVWKQNGVSKKIEEMITLFTGVEHGIKEDELLDFFTFQFLIRAELIS